MDSAEPGGSLKSDSTYFVAYRYGNHAGPSGYDRFADFLGEPVRVSERWRWHGETTLRVPAKLIGWYNGSYEYGRHEFIQELATAFHMRKHRNSLYHFLYAEKSLRFLASHNGRRGHVIVGSFHQPASQYAAYFRSTRHFRGLAHAVVVSRSQIDHLESIVGAGKVSFVPYAVDTGYFHPGRSSNQSRPRRCVCAGHHLRDCENLPGIIRGILAREPDVEFVVIGAPRSLEETIRAIPGAVWKRGIPDEEYRKTLQQSDLLVLPMIGSTSVTTVNEALGCGLPVITNFGGVVDYLTEPCSVVLPVGDVDGMIDAAVELLRDEARRKSMAAASRQQALELSWPRSAARMRALYDRLRNQGSVE